jgi:hypothetical protein
MYQLSVHRFWPETWVKKVPVIWAAGVFRSRPVPARAKRCLNSKAVYYIAIKYLPNNTLADSCIADSKPTAAATLHPFKVRGGLDLIQKSSGGISRPQFSTNESPSFLPSLPYQTSSFSSHRLNSYNPLQKKITRSSTVTQKWLTRTQYGFKRRTVFSCGPSTGPLPMPLPLIPRQLPYRYGIRSTWSRLLNGQLQLQLQLRHHKSMLFSNISGQFKL